MATSNIDVSQLLDVSNPQSHCNQAHAHDPLPWPLPACDCQSQLLWSMSDAGYNEGAQAAASIALQVGLYVPPLSPTSPATL